MEERKLPKMPRFANEAEEAQWWFDHRHELEQDIVAAARHRGGLGKGAVARFAKKLEEAKAVSDAPVSSDSVPVS